MYQTSRGSRKVGARCWICFAEVVKIVKTTDPLYSMSRGRGTWRELILSWRRANGDEVSPRLPGQAKLALSTGQTKIAWNLDTQ